MGLDCETMFRSLWPQCDGICRPPDAGSSFDPTAGEQHLVGRHADGEAQRAVAIVGVEPVVAGFELHAGGDENGLVAGTADLEVDQALVLELNFLVVDTPRQDHRPIRSEKILTAEPMGIEWARRVVL